MLKKEWLRPTKWNKREKEWEAMFGEHTQMRPESIPIHTHIEFTIRRNTLWLPFFVSF